MVFLSIVPRALNDLCMSITRKEIMTDVDEGCNPASVLTRRTSVTMETDHTPSFGCVTYLVAERFQLVS